MDRRKAADPSPQEIAERCAEIQAGWSEAMRAARATADTEDKPVVVQRVSVEHVDGGEQM